ncbi:MAG: hypothetical protein K2W96_11595, partial [Gemmataceae bacterium]|nr:hypothetical protein [Gemmataceae bacterium]
MTAATFLIVILLILVPALLLLARRHREQAARDEVSPITRQHIELFQGGTLNENAVESVKARFRALLERGEVDAVERSLRGGMQYVVQVRALAELGTEEAGLILERQLRRRLSDDAVEQAWYWIDVAGGLRSLNRSQSLPHLLRTAELAGDTPLSHFLAAETVCFLGFAGYARQPDSALGRAALRVLLRAIDGMRYGVQPTVITEGRLGEIIEAVWDNRLEGVDPLAVRLFREAVRLLRRKDTLERQLAHEPAELETLEWQLSRLAALQPSLEDYLADAPGDLARRLPSMPLADQREALAALAELRGECAEAVLPLLDQPRYPHLDQAVEALAWSKDARVGPMLRDLALQKVPMVRRAQSRPQAGPPRRPSLSSDIPYRSILRALRGHPSSQAEALLILAARDWDPTFRHAAVSSLGWWEPVARADVLHALNEARRDPCPEVKQAARAALARLGERQALLSFRNLLTSENSQGVYDAIQAIANEGLTLLWPDLDRLADSEESDVAQHAREALERMSEDRQIRRTGRLRPIRPIRPSYCSPCRPSSRCGQHDLLDPVQFLELLGEQAGGVVVVAAVDGDRLALHLATERSEPRVRLADGRDPRLHPRRSRHHGDG